MRRLPLLLMLVVAGCGHSPPTRFLTLDPAPPAPASVRADYRGPPLSISAVRLPAALDRVDYVAEASAGTAKVSDFDRWIAAPGVLARDALVQDLTARLPEGSVLPGAPAGRPGGVRLDVTVLAFDGGAGTAEIAYQLASPAGTVRRVVQLSAPGGDPAAGARAFAIMLGTLADRVVADLPTASR